MHTHGLPSPSSPWAFLVPHPLAFKKLTLQGFAQTSWPHPLPSTFSRCSFAVGIIRSRFFCTARGRFRAPLKPTLDSSVSPPTNKPPPSQFRPRSRNLIKRRKQARLSLLKQPHCIKRVAVFSDRLPDSIGCITINSRQREKCKAMRTKVEGAFKRGWSRRCNPAAPKGCKKNLIRLPVTEAPPLSVLSLSQPQKAPLDDLPR